MSDIILYKKDRNYEVEELGIKMLAKRVKSCITEDDIRNTLIDNGFNGIYMLSNDKFRQLKDDENVHAYYIPIDRKIVVNGDYYKDHKDIIVHELVHAYLNLKSNSSINVNEKTISYGRGLEEGCCSIIQKVNTINNIDDCVVEGYHYQAHLIKQLNALYKYSSSKKYPNLIHHLLKEPNDFLPAIARMYEDILDKLDIDIDVANIGLRSALAIVASTDSMVDDKEYDFQTSYTINSCMNDVYLFLENKRIRNEEKTNDLFPTFNQTFKTKEDRLQELIFNSESAYFYRQVKAILSLLNMQQEELEVYSEYKMPEYNCIERVKKKY